MWMQDSIPAGDSAIISLILNTTNEQTGEFNKPANIKDWLGNSYYLALLGELVHLEDLHSDSIDSVIDLEEQ